MCFQRCEMFACCSDHGLRHAGELRDLQPIALRCGALLYRMKKYNRVFMLDGRQMYIRAASMRVWQLRQLEVMRRKKGQTAIGLQ